MSVYSLALSRRALSTFSKSRPPSIENAIKLYRPYYQTVLYFRPVSIDQPYFVAEHVRFVDPLQYMYIIILIKRGSYYGVYSAQN